MAVCVAATLVGACAGEATIGAPTASPVPERIVESTAIAGRPSAITTGDGRIWVAEDQVQTVHVLDAASRDLVGEPIALEANPIALDASAGAVWVGHAGGTVTKIDAETRETTTIEVGESVTDVVAGPASVWVCDLAGSQVIEVDPESLEVVRRVAVEAGAVRATLTPDRLWVTGTERTVTAVDPTSGEIGPTAEVGSGPIGIAYDGERIWVANSDDGTVSRFDAATGERLGDDVTTGRGPVAVAVVDDVVWVGNQDDRTVVGLDPETGRSVARLFVETNIRDLAAGEALWVTGTDPNVAVMVS